MSQQLSVSEKYSLSFAEAALYTGIGRDKLYQLVKDNPGAAWHFGIGNRTRIKRKLFEEYLNQINKL